MSSDLIDKAIQVINNFISLWTKKYLYNTIYEADSI